MDKVARWAIKAAYNFLLGLQVGFFLLMLLVFIGVALGVVIGMARLVASV